MGDGAAVDPAITAIIDKLNEEISLSMKNGNYPPLFQSNKLTSKSHLNGY